MQPNQPHYMSEILTVLFESK